MKVSITRKATMYSLTRFWTDSQDTPMQIKVVSVLKRTRNKEIPSTPTW